MKLTYNTYGKADVGVLKIFRDDYRDTIHQLNVSIRLTGEFDANYTEGDNTSCIPTDTCKNTVYALCQDVFDGCISDFAAALGQHFLDTYAHVSSADITIVETPWESQHNHGFRLAAGGKPTANALMLQSGGSHVAGIRELTILKSTGSSFTGFHQCANTSLAESTDRVLATHLEAEWTFAHQPSDATATREAVLAAMLPVFYERESPSIQRTLYWMGEAALKADPSLENIRLVMPNVHFFPFDFAKIGREDNNDILYPAPAPYGDIEAVVMRNT